MFNQTFIVHTLIKSGRILKEKQPLSFIPTSFTVQINTQLLFPLSQEEQDTTINEKGERDHPY